MKSILLTLSILMALFLNLSLYGQKVIISEDFAIAGDSIGVSTSTDFSIDYTTTGENVIWDYSNLQENSQLFEIAYSISSAGFIINFQFGSFAPSEYKASYYQPYDALPLDQIGNFLPVNIEAINKLTKVSDDLVSIVGYSFKVDGNQVGFRSDTIETYYKLPLEYGDSSFSRGYTKFDFNPFYDAVFLQYRQHKVVADGYGQLITPYSTYNNVLRVHHTIKEQDSLQITLFGSPQWIPIHRTINEYEWWDNEKKRPVLKIETEGLGSNSVPSRITFLNNQVVGLKEELIETAIYPNPTSHLVTIKSKQNLKNIEIWSMEGKRILEFPCSGKKIGLNVENLPTGTYTLKLISEKGQRHESIIIK